MWRALLIPPPVGRDLLIAETRRTDAPHVLLRADPLPGTALFAIKRPASEDIRRIVELLARLNQAWLRDQRRAGRSPALLYDRALRQTPDLALDGKPEIWLAAPWIYAWAPLDCKGAAALRLAELRDAGVRAEAKVDGAMDRRGVLRYHVRVRHGGRLEDPARILGKGG